MSVDATSLQLASGDPGNRSKIPAPAPVNVAALSQQLSPEQIKALAALAAGQSVREVAKSAGVARCTVYAWLKQDPHFRAAFNAWKEELLESGRARLLKASDTAITTLIKAVANGDARAAMSMLKGIGMFTAPHPGSTDPAILRREMELDRRQARIDLAVRSDDVAGGEKKQFYHEVCEAERAESRRSEEQMKRAEAQAARDKKKDDQAASDPKGASGGD